jgi:hypothetical protein
MLGFLVLLKARIEEAVRLNAEAAAALLARSRQVGARAPSRNGHAGDITHFKAWDGSRDHRS